MGKTSRVIYQPREAVDYRLIDMAPYIQSGRLVPVGARSKLSLYLKDLWGRRSYIWYDSRTKVRTQNNEHRLGTLWLLVKPLLDIVFYGLLFGVLLKASRGIDNYPAYIIIGVLMFQYISSVMNNAAGVMNQSKPMMRAFSFPRMAIPLSMLVRQTLQMGPILAVMIVGLIAIPPHQYPSPTWAMFIPVFALNSVFLFGLSLIIARYAFILPDIKQLLSFVTRVLMYGSGIIFPIERFVNHPVLAQVIQANPVYIFIDLYRQVLLNSSWGSLESWAGAGAWTVGTLLVGFFIFWRAEEVFGRELR